MRILQSKETSIVLGKRDSIELSHLAYYALLSAKIPRTMAVNQLMIVEFEEDELGKGIKAGIAAIWAVKE